MYYQTLLWYNYLEVVRQFGVDSFLTFNTSLKSEVEVERLLDTHYATASTGKK